MAKSIEITFTISEDGEIVYHIKGIKGRQCEDIVKLLESLGEMTEISNTSEYYQKDNETIITTGVK